MLTIKFYQSQAENNFAVFHLSYSVQNRLLLQAYIHTKGRSNFLISEYLFNLPSTKHMLKFYTTL